MFFWKIQKLYLTCRQQVAKLLIVATICCGCGWPKPKGWFDFCGWSCMSLKKNKQQNKFKFRCSNERGQQTYADLEWDQMLMLVLIQTKNNEQYCQQGVTGC